MKHKALTGLARSGKDTVASIIQRNVPGTITYALASPIKHVVYTLMGITEAIGESQKDLTLHYTITAEQQQDAADIYSKYRAKAGEAVMPEFWEYWSMLKHKGLISFSMEADEGVENYVGSLRVLLQLFGTDFGRSLNNDVWLILAPTGAVITDIRFDNEAEWFRKLGYDIVKVERDTGSYKVAQHVSEAGVNPALIDTVIHNSGTLVDLENKVLNLIN